MIPILDVSEWQETVDWRRVRAAGIETVLIRATHGNSGVDRHWLERLNGARLAGLRVGFYHYAFPLMPGDAMIEAHHFARTVREHMHRTDLRHVLDFEAWPGKLTPAQMAEWARTWNRVVRAETGVGPMFYANPDMIQRLHATQTIGYGLWLSAYDRNDGKEHPFTIPAPWRKAVAHQFTSRAKVPGVTGLCDLSSARSLWPLLAHRVTGRV